MDKHTPTPWRVEVGTTQIWGGCDPDNNTSYGMGVPVANCRVIGVDDGEANAAMIVEAVNSHASLVESVKALSECLEAYTAKHKPFSMKPIGADGSPARLEQELEIGLYGKARAAIARAHELSKQVQP